MKTIVLQTINDGAVEICDRETQIIVIPDQVAIFDNSRESLAREGLKVFCL